MFKLPGLPGALPAKTSPADGAFVVVDFGARVLRLARVDLSTGRPLVTAYVCRERSVPDTDEQQKNLLKEAVSELGAPPRAPATLVWEEGMSVRQLTLPEMPRDELANALSWEMRNRFSIQLEQHLFDAQLVWQEQLPDGTREKLYTLYTCDKRLALERIEWARAAGLETVALVPGQAALARMAGTLFPGKEVLVCDVGYQSARILVEREGQQLLSRTVAQGGKQLTDAMKGTLLVKDERVTLDLPAAEKLKIEQGALDPQAPHIPLLRPYLERLLGEVRRSIDYYDAQKHSKPVEGLWFTGGGGALKGIEAFFGQFLSLEILEAPAEYRDGLGLTGEAARLWQASAPANYAWVGAVIGSGEGVNLLPRKSGAESGDRLKRMGVRVGLAAVALALATLTAFTGARYLAVRSELAATQAQWQEISRMGSLLSGIAERERFRRAALKGDLAHPALLKEIAAQIPDEVVLNEMEFDRASGTLVLRGEAAGGSGPDVKPVARWISSLQESGFFKEVTLVSSTGASGSSAGRSAFELHCLTAGVE